MYSFYLITHSVQNTFVDRERPLRRSWHSPHPLARLGKGQVRRQRRDRGMGGKKEDKRKGGRNERVDALPLFFILDKRLKA